jgi:hypothetical protein
MRMLSALALVAFGLVAAADEKDKKKEPTGSFVRKADQMELKLEFKKDKELVFHGTVGDAGFVMTSKYMKDADGIYHCEVTNFEKKGDFPVSKDKGYKFTFKLEVKEKSVVMSDLTGDEIAEEQKKAVEGEYEKAAGD